MLDLGIIQNEDTKVYFTSDLHLGHKNIVRGISKWVGTHYNSTRIFETLEDHDNHIIDNINNTVRKNDILFILGDFSWGGMNHIIDYRDRILCDNIHAIYGNHDDELYNTNNLFLSINRLSKILIDEQNITLCHYPLEEWEKCHRGNWMLYGHVHSKLGDGSPYKKLDVGVDNALKLLGEYRPFSFYEINEIMSNRINLPHHI